ncbi:MAG TPA: hypothetical protein VFL47_13345, partial [Flavisolibacter sp.]|nr:hypothetical protein [Flavisolibacter sp.]
MLQIKITGVDALGKLRLSDHGRSEAMRNQNVHWKVDDPSGTVVGITAIELKADIPNNTNIFSHHPPQRQGTNPVAKNWVATVNDKKADAPNFAEYHYAISW